MIYEFFYITSCWVPLSNILNSHNLDFNFKKQRFFPQLENFFLKKTVFNASLGIISKFFSKSKKFLRSKNSYIFLATYFRRFLTYLNISNLYLFIRKIPKYLKDILRVLLSKANVLYKNPFKHEVINEKKKSVIFNLSYIYFYNNKPHGVIRRKKRGRLKRKIMKRIILLNSLID